MRISFADTAPEGAHALAFPVAKGALEALPLAGLEAGDVAHARLTAAAQRFEGDSGSIVEFFVGAGDGVRRVLLVGIGKAAPTDLEKAGGALVARLQTSGETRLVVTLGGEGGDAEAAARVAFGAAQRNWRIDTYRTKLTAKQKPTLEELIVIGGGSGADEAWSRLSAIAEGLFLTRELVSEPPNIIYPESFVERCRSLAELGVEIEVLDEAAMAAAGMGALLGVSQGSAREAQVLVMRWNGAESADQPTVAFVGKGVTFDTGGISLKPGAGMEDMKWDMGGAGAVAGAMKALALRKARANVIGVCGLVENMPSGTAQRPGDVVTSMSGQTIEVINTDAEGRLVLCDVITWVQRNHSPSVIVDLATLTGAMIIALGNEYAGLFSNDDTLADQLLAVGKAVGDPLWRFPLSDDYDKLIDSPIADMKNVGPRGAGSITAAQFIQRFVDEGVKWAHLDIAGMVWSDKATPLWEKGATGYGVRLLDRLVADQFEG
ncbi:leucyl aminopeptidase [Sphingomonas zeicaulis]|uniref:leucyl aminopeptidase n=1 Tax=Sphingomonas zeicaulis TaxID=1632740 RepID=UPI003D1C9E1B